MYKPTSVDTLNKLGRVRLSPHFFMREMLYSEVANFHGMPNIPDNPDLAIAAGEELCNRLLEPLHATFGHVSVRSAYRSYEVNKFCCVQQKKVTTARVTTPRAIPGTDSKAICSWGPRRVSSFPGSWSILKPTRTGLGPPWHGGYMTTAIDCLILNCAFFPSTPLLTFVGADGWRLGSPSLSIR